MHAVNRGREPAQLERIRSRFTAGWVAHYDHGAGPKPADRHWRKFQTTLSSKFSDNCGYCEECCRGDIDHFRPKSRFPERVYVWSNWILACHFCNNKKGEQWADECIDPCANARRTKAESFFTFELSTGEIQPRQGLSSGHVRRAERTIDLLGLNSYHHLKKRVQWLAAVRMALEVERSADERLKIVEYLTSRERELSSITRELIASLHHAPV